MRDREVRHASDPGRSTTWFEWPGGVPIHLPGPTAVNPLRSRRLLVLGLIAGALLAALLWRRSSPVSAPITAVGARWNVDLASAGGRPVTALVFGREAGVHVVRVPAAGASEEEQRRVSARLANGDVYMVSLGREVLSVHSKSPAGTAPMAFTARARFVKLYHTPQATGIRTGWW
jgi:hypothetical protein